MGKADWISFHCHFNFFYFKLPWCSLLRKKIWYYILLKIPSYILKNSLFLKETLPYSIASPFFFNLIIFTFFHHTEAIQKHHVSLLSGLLISLALPRILLFYTWFDKWDEELHLSHNFIPAVFQNCALLLDEITLVILLYLSPSTILTISPPLELVLRLSKNLCTPTMYRVLDKWKQECKWKLLF